METEILAIGSAWCAPVPPGLRGRCQLTPLRASGDKDRPC